MAAQKATARLLKRMQAGERQASLAVVVAIATENEQDDDDDDEQRDPDQQKTQNANHEEFNRTEQAKCSDHGYVLNGSEPNATNVVGGMIAIQ